MSGIDCGTIKEGFEMTPREYSVCKVMLDSASPMRETDCAARTACFMEAYKGIRNFPGPDMAEFIAGETRTKAKDWERRREVIENMLRRARYEPTQAELGAYSARKKAGADDLMAFREKHGLNETADREPVEIYRERRHGAAGVASE